MNVAALATLTRPGNLAFPSNLSLVKEFSSSGGRIIRQSTGHFIVYGPHHRRILATDPDGNPLHECEWGVGPNGAVCLAKARFRLDWGQWIGLKPGGLVNTTILDLSRKSGWERLRADDLRQMAAQAMGVSLDEVRFFYGDQDLHIDTHGRATIRHRKDAFYILDDRTFEAASTRVRFMACMGAMHWDRIDFLPVVELFQSLLPGTGSAAFELIRGLYDDQNEQTTEPRPLRYRGIPTYPSEAAFRLFSGFFRPHTPSGQDPFQLFIDPSHSHEVTWLPASEPPRRYFDLSRHLCATIQAGTVQKATLADDPTGLPYVNDETGRGGPYQRRLEVNGGTLKLLDGMMHRDIAIPPSWGRVRETATPREAGGTLKFASGSNWRALFEGHPPPVAPTDAFSAVLLYPDDDREIGELPTQPFAADYVHDLLEDVPALSARLARADRVLVHGFDAALTTCLDLNRPRQYTLLYHHAAYAQKQAQLLWSLLSKGRHVDWIANIRFLPAADHQSDVHHNEYDLVYQWLPFHQYSRTEALEETAEMVAGALSPYGLAFVVGPLRMGTMFSGRLRILKANPVEGLPTFRMHQSVLPNARIKPDVTLFHLVKE